MPATVAIGDLRERVFIQRDAGASRDAVGGLVPSWETVANVWARVAPMSTGEQFRRQQMQANANWKVTVRYRNDLSPKMRVVWGSRTFEVKGVTNADERRRFLDLACEELSVA
jgi:SPP1 family predicted phage head-tail adaptor